ncbi:MAG: AAA family ATPase, partial [Thermoplasmata archaeon]
MATAPTRARKAPAPASPSEAPSEAPAPTRPVRPPPFIIESQQEILRWLNLLIYGDYGVGKTHLAGTSADVPQMRDVILINAEAGDLTLSGKEYSFPLIDSIRVNDYATVARVYDFLKVHCKYRDANDTDKLRDLEARLRGVDAKKIKKPRMYRTVLIDSGTEVESYCMNALLGITDATKMDEEMASAEWGEYKRNLNMVKRMVRNFRDLPMHVIMTCAQRWVQDEAKKFNYHPAMTGQLSDAVQGFMDMVGYYITSGTSEEGKTNRRLYVAPTGRFKAKCRISGFKGTHFDNPVMKDITKAIGLLK